MTSPFDDLVASTNDVFMTEFGEKEDAYYEPVGKLTKRVDIIFNPEPSFINLDIMTVESGVPTALISTTDAYSLTVGAKLVFNETTYYVLKFQDVGNDWTLLDLTKDTP